MRNRFLKPCLQFPVRETAFFDLFSDFRGCVTVKGGYTPDVIVVQKGHPVRLTFNARNKVLFPDFNKNAALPEGKPVTLEFTPDQPGEYGFQCQMGMLRGKLIVE